MKKACIAVVSVLAVCVCAVAALFIVSNNNDDDDDSDDYDGLLLHTLRAGGSDTDE